MSNRISLFPVLLIVSNCLYAQKTVKADEAALFSDNVFYLTEVMFHDVVNPPAAARFYAYSTLAAAHVVSSKSAHFSFKDIVNEYPDKVIPGNEKINPTFSATYAMLETGKQIIPSGSSLEEKQLALYKQYAKQGEKKSVLDNSVLYAKAVAESIVRYAKTDGYLKLSTLQRYQPKETDSTWYPTPPEYMAAVEPNWSTVRTFFLDSCNQFAPSLPVPFSSDKNSAFYSLLEEVYTRTKHLTEEEKLIANYWDCNPFATFYSGHVSVGIKKISPGGHWMNITGIACKKAKLDFSKTVQLHALIAMTLHDSFVSCWSEKYRSDRIRPKTAINRFVDEQWNPLLETPPFPEYTSGHSVISTACANVLTFALGDNFQFTDNTEVIFGLPERTFPSFLAAAQEAAISRLFGGIHYRDGIENGQKQGEEISHYIIKKIKATSKIDF